MIHLLLLALALTTSFKAVVSVNGHGVMYTDRQTERVEVLLPSPSAYQCHREPIEVKNGEFGVIFTCTNMGGGLVAFGVTCRDDGEDDNTSYTLLDVSPTAEVVKVLFVAHCHTGKRAVLL